jgi:hypothetical protein
MRMGNQAKNKSFPDLKTFIDEMERLKLDN